MVKKLNISKKNLEIVKTFLQCQILMESLDSVNNESGFTIKHETSKYLKKLEKIVEPVILSMFKSNEKLFNRMINKLRKDINGIDNFFEIID
jgi:hypothetical protein